MAVRAFNTDISTARDGIVIDDEHTRFLVIAEGVNPQGLTLTPSLAEAINVAISKCMKDLNCYQNTIYKIHPKCGDTRQKIETVRWSEEGDYLYSVNSDRCNTARDVFAAVMLDQARLDQAVNKEVAIQDMEGTCHRMPIKYHIIINYYIHREAPGEREIRHKIIAFTSEDALQKAKAIADANCSGESSFTVVRLVTMSSFEQKYTEVYRAYPKGI